MFAKQSYKTTVDFTSYHQCRLGMWNLEGESKEHFSDLQAYQEINALHQQEQAQ